MWFLSTVKVERVDQSEFPTPRTMSIQHSSLLFLDSIPEGKEGSIKVMYPLSQIKELKYKKELFQKFKLIELGITI